MERLLQAARRVSLEDAGGWRAALFLVFLLGMCVRFLVYTDLTDKPAGRIEEWFGSEPWFYAELGKKIVERNDWSLAGRNLLITREMLNAAPERDWARWSGNKLPRGALGVFILAGSFGMTASLALYKLLSCVAGAMVGVCCAGAAAFLFGNRRVGFLAGIGINSLQTAIIASLYPGPWVWEALAFSSLLLLYARIRNGGQGITGDWLLFGVIAGLAIWLRPLFHWAPILALVGILSASLREGKNWKRHLAGVAAMAVSFVLLAAGLSVRNASVHATKAPIVGQQGWEFLLNTNPGAVLGPAVPADAAVIDAAGGSFARALTVASQVGSYTKAAPRVLTRKLRELVGARDVASSINADYVEARSRLLGLMGLTSDVAMAAGWGAIALLVILRRFPKPLAVVMGILLGHGLLFGTSGLDRLLLVLCFAMLGGAGFVIAWEERRRVAAMPFVFLALWGVAQLLLQVDDHARGSRYRAADFIAAASDYRRSGDEREFREELKAMKRVRLTEADMEGYWNAQR